MKKVTLIAALFGLVLLGSCTQKSCPTYAQSNVDTSEVVAD